MASPDGGDNLIAIPIRLFVIGLSQQVFDFWRSLSKKYLPINDILHHGATRGCAS